MKSTRSSPDLSRWISSHEPTRQKVHCQVLFNKLFLFLFQNQTRFWCFMSNCCCGWHARGCNHSLNTSCSGWCVWGGKTCAGMVSMVTESVNPDWNVTLWPDYKSELVTTATSWLYFVFTKQTGLHLGAKTSGFTAPDFRLKLHPLG